MLWFYTEDFVSTATLIICDSKSRANTIGKKTYYDISKNIHIYVVLKGLKQNSCEIQN